MSTTNEMKTINIESNIESNIIHRKRRAMCVRRRERRNVPYIHRSGGNKVKMLMRILFAINLQTLRLYEATSVTIVTAARSFCACHVSVWQPTRWSASKVFHFFLSLFSLLLGARCVVSNSFIRFFIVSAFAWRVCSINMTYRARKHNENDERYDLNEQNILIAH